MQDFVDVDGFEIPADRAQEYIIARETCAKVAETVYQKCADKVVRLFARSEDGEAVVGLDKDGTIVCLAHLDPQSVQKMCAALKMGKLEEYLTDLDHFPFL